MPQISLYVKESHFEKIEKAETVEEIFENLKL